MSALLCLLPVLFVVAPATPSAAASTPVLVKWSVTPTTLPDSGGTVTLSAQVSQVATCTFTSFPAAPGLPVTDDCSGGSASATITLPANNTTSVEMYGMRLYLNGGSPQDPAPIAVAVAAHPTTAVKSLSVTPSSLSFTGGPVTVAATVSAAVNCTFASVPALPGLPVTLPCSGGSASTTVTLPPNSGPLPVVYSFSITPTGWGKPSPQPVQATVYTAPAPGYLEVATDGGVFAFGTAHFWGSTGGIRLNKPIVGMATTARERGYWLVASDGGVFSFGNAKFYGSEGDKKLNRPIVGMAATADGGGYWLVASDGGIFTFGDAQFYGSTGGQPLKSPVVGMAADPVTGGYWMVTASGGVFTFNAAYYGTGGSGSGVVDITATPSGNGFWTVNQSGGVVAFGGAGNFGSLPGVPSGATVVGMAPTPTGLGYALASTIGAVYTFGNAQFLGSMAGAPLNKPIVTFASSN